MTEFAQRSAPTPARERGRDAFAGHRFAGSGQIASNIDSEDHQVCAGSHELKLLLASLQCKTRN